MGEELPYALVADLEAHLKNCPECMAIAQAKRESLKGVLASEITGRKIAQPQHTTSKRAEELKKAITSGVVAIQSPADVFAIPDSEFKAEKMQKPNNKKAVAYSIGLALLLVLMSTVFKDPTKLFGPRAATIQKDTPPLVESAPAAPIEEPVVKATSEPVAVVTPTDKTPEVVAENTKENNQLNTDGFIVADSVEGTSVVQKDPKPDPKPETVNKAHKPEPSTNSIKVYPLNSK